MIEFLAALVVFLALHSIPSIPAIRGRLVAFLGRRTYLALYSLVSLLALAWVFHAAFKLDYVELWPPAAWQAWVPMILSPLALFLLAAGLSSPNPASISFRRETGKEGAITAITRHPVLWGFFLWAFSHVVANGDLRSLILFGSFGLFALGGIFMMERRASRRLGAGWPELASRTSIIPFAALASGRAHWRVDREMLIAVLLAAIVTAWLLLGGHAVLFGADPLALTTI